MLTGQIWWFENKVEPSWLNGSDDHRLHLMWIYEWTRTPPSMSRGEPEMDEHIKIDLAEIANLNALLDRASAETPVSQFRLAEHLLRPRPCQSTTSGIWNLIRRLWPLSRLFR